MRNIQLQQGETLRLSVYVEEEGAQSAEFVATNGVTEIINSTAAFSGFKADLTTSDTIKPPGSYDYYVRITWDDGSTDIVPDDTDCDGVDGCELPKLIICEIPGVS